MTNRVVFVVTDKTGTELVEVNEAKADNRIPVYFLRNALQLAHIRPPGRPLWLCHESKRVQIIALYSSALLALWVTWANAELEDSRGFGHILMEGYRSPKRWMQFVLDGNYAVD